MIMGNVDIEIEKKIKQLPHTVFNAYNEKISKIEEVESVYAFLRDDKIMDIWTIIRAYDFDVEQKIAEVDAKIVGMFKGISFDFLTLSKADIEDNPSLVEHAKQIYQF